MTESPEQQDQFSEECRLVAQEEWRAFCKPVLDSIFEESKLLEGLVFDAHKNWKNWDIEQRIAFLSSLADEMALFFNVESSKVISSHEINVVPELDKNLVNASAGMYYCRGNERFICINYDIITAHGDLNLVRCLAHEFAHSIIQQKANMLMRDLNVDPKVTGFSEVLASTERKDYPLFMLSLWQLFFSSDAARGKKSSVMGDYYGENHLSLDDYYEVLDEKLVEDFAISFLNRVIRCLVVGGAEDKSEIAISLRKNALEILRNLDHICNTYGVVRFTSLDDLILSFEKMSNPQIEELDKNIFFSEPMITDFSNYMQQEFDVFYEKMSHRCHEDKMPRVFKTKTDFDVTDHIAVRELEVIFNYFYAIQDVYSSLSNKD